MVTFLNLSGVRRLPLIRQAEAAECGLACIAMVAGFHGYEADLSTLRRKFSLSLKGATLKTLVDIAAGLGLGARSLRCELDQLKDLRAPAILHWGMNHFVVLKRVRGDRLELHDPAVGARTLRMAEAEGLFTGIALELTPTDGFQRKREKNVLKLSTLAKLSPQTLSALAQVMLLSLIIELFVIASPFYMQLTIDQAVLKGDLDLLGALALGFALVLIFNVVSSALRGLTMQFVSNVLAFEMQARVFHHLVRLPLDWFHKRQVGDIQSRFNAIDPIQQFIANGAISAILDGVLGVFVLALMFYFAPTLAWIVFAAMVIYAGLRMAMLDLQRRVAGDFIIADAKEQTRFLETLRAAQTIKLGGHENTREAQQRNAIAATINAGIRSGNVSIGFGALNQLLSGGVDVLVVFLAARAIIAGDFTIGMMTAFMAYKGQFVQRTTALIENLIAWRLLDVQLERLADIALHPREPRIDDEGSDHVIQGAVEVRRIGFRYAAGEPEVLRGADLKIAPGEFVAIAGSSGGGKSTLLKILVGLYQPTYGEVHIDGKPMNAWAPRALRAQIGFVAQDDVLLQGTIAENIAGFDERIDMVRVRSAATSACIAKDVEAMPMGFQTLVGDMGSTLSGGQKQRVLIARALYREPRILILDEGTSSLDIETERAVNAALSQLAITRIVVAHRPETLRAAGRVVALHNGQIHALPPPSTPQPAAQSPLF